MTKEIINERTEKQMIELGIIQKLQLVKKTDFGVYLATEEDKEDKVLLPKKQVPENAEIGDEIEVFVYRDSSDRLICTTNIPKIKMSELAVLKVNDVTPIGAFLDWGLERDLFLPFKEQTKKVSPGEEYLVALYKDKSSRLAATMKVYPYMQIADGYVKDDEVSGIVYEISEQFGAFVAIDNMYFGLVPGKEVHNNVNVGDVIKGRVTSIRDDGKINISIFQKAYIQMDEDSEKVLSVINQFDGVLPYNDKADPEIIYKDFNMSKAAFKRAVGKLFKERKIEIKPNCIKIIK
jgi:predicted RNA-binding protein (virulence factor B family)